MGYIVSGGVIYSGGGGGGGGSTTFSGLTDVVIDSATLASGQVPIYNAATSKWENADVTAPSNLTDLGDVNITSPSNGQIVRYDATSGKFIASDEQTGDYVAVSQILSTGTKIAGIIVDGTETEVFAPTPPSISITQIQSTGTKIATITVDSSDVDIYAPEGGGSGGHTILDDGGTSLTQRSNLQFKGTYSSDDSTNEITEVNIVRSMTKAEFDLLSSAEKQGIINITDVADVDADGVGYDNTSSGLTATDAQAAIDELSDAIPTILNDSGTSLTQRPNLQFKGAYSEDNSAGETTKVNVARTMTLAEFEELTEAEKTGFINVKDETSGSDDKFQPLIYSAEEREVGVWINGKPLYQKTLTCTTDTNIGPNDWATMPWDDEPTDIDFLVTGQNHQGDVPNSYATTRVAYTGGHLKMAALYSSTFSAGKKFTVWYTKTTDVPGSGKWTPQGVPAVHYSTDEQVVGTWIDGKPLYEKTLKVGTISSTSEQYFETNILSADVDTYFIKESFIITSTGLAWTTGGSNDSFFHILFLSNGTTNLRVSSRVSSNAMYGDLYVTIRYTKSST